MGLCHEPPRLQKLTRLERLCCVSRSAGGISYNDGSSRCSSYCPGPPLAQPSPRQIAQCAGESNPAIGRERGLPLLSHATRASPRVSPFKPQARTDPRPLTRPHGARTQRARGRIRPLFPLWDTHDCAIAQISDGEVSALWASRGVGMVVGLTSVTLRAPREAAKISGQ